MKILNVCCNVVFTQDHIINKYQQCSHSTKEYKRLLINVSLYGIWRILSISICHRMYNLLCKKFCAAAPPLLSKKSVSWLYWNLRGRAISILFKLLVKFWLDRWYLHFPLWFSIAVFFSLCIIAFTLIWHLNVVLPINEYVCVTLLCQCHLICSLCCIFKIIYHIYTYIHIYVNL